MFHQLNFRSLLYFRLPKHFLSIENAHFTVFYESYLSRREGRIRKMIFCFLNGPLYLYFCLFNTFDSRKINVHNNSLPMNGLELRTSGVGSDRSTKWATTTTRFFVFVVSNAKVVLYTKCVNTDGRNCWWENMKIKRALCKMQNASRSHRKENGESRERRTYRPRQRGRR